LCEKQLEKVCEQSENLRPKEGQLGDKRITPRYHDDLKHRNNHTNHTKPGH